jgi:hypothetical protein
MALGRVLVWSALVTLSVVVVPSSPSYAEALKPLKPVKRQSSESADALLAAQLQIARLRQTADQLRLLADQPVPVNAKGDTRQEFRKHEEWLRQAGHRVNVLAAEWEQRVKPTANSDASTRATDVNPFFESQSAVLKSKLHRESLALDTHSEPVRSSSDTARLVIGKMQ